MAATEGLYIGDEVDYIDQGRSGSHTLTESDLQMIKLIVQETQLHAANCRFDTIERNDLEEAVRFYRNFNTMMEDSKKTIRNTFLGILVLIFVGLMTEGFWGKLISKLK
jgi:hypothetical protein